MSQCLCQDPGSFNCVHSVHIRELLQQLGGSIAGHGHQGLDSSEIVELKSPVNISGGQDVIIKGPGFSVNIILENSLIIYLTDGVMV